MLRKKASLEVISCLEAEKASDKNLLLLKVNMGAGHGGASGRYDAYKDQAFIYAFLLNDFGITKQEVVKECIAVIVLHFEGVA